ncbi:MBOAT family O-acyltransferase [Campylobacter sp. TTU_617]|uniref:MBOAT family O-acyltransferase n=2 Tax=unclassified Campylobacter TaxID=2593542 RepID=UPI0019056DFF|nr:MBOAT family O-acyltransferase [Campylobacter sp. TTU_617]MBK1972014.1 MBOAT family protein [Campylobacter sp. TTU_617]
MTFFSLEFSILISAFFIIYWIFKKYYKIQNILVLLFSYLVYTLINPYFALILLVYTFFIHYFALLIFTREKKYILFISIISVILNLCFFKYFSDIKDNLNIVFNYLGLDFLSIDIVFPMGISFYTFNSITYLVSVYKKHKVESFINLAIYLSFFPTLLLGPIMKSEFFFNQIFKKRDFNNIDLIFVLLLFGIFKKVFLANYLEIYSKEILDYPQNYSFLELLSAIYAYALQIYCDFSGYIDLVSAFALMLGFNLPINFNMPYLATNLKDFWARWHISLSNFIKEYIYIPLGGNQKGHLRTYLNIIIAFCLSGIWHGNTINFFIWGLLHSFGVIFNHAMPFKLKKFPFIARFITFHFICFTWIFFYYSKLDDSFEYLKACYENFYLIPDYKTFYILIIFFILFIVYPSFINYKKNCTQILQATPLILKPIIVAFLLLLIFTFIPNEIPNFIYSSF